MKPIPSSRKPPNSDREFWDWYAEYLKTDEWRDRRAQVLTRARGMCEGCGIQPAKQVHHVNYERVGHEMLFDLAAVCDDCHLAIHSEPRRIKPVVKQPDCTCVGSFMAVSCPHHGAANALRDISNLAREAVRGSETP